MRSGGSLRALQAPGQPCAAQPAQPQHALSAQCRESKPQLQNAKSTHHVRLGRPGGKEGGDHRHRRQQQRGQAGQGCAAGHRRCWMGMREPGRPGGWGEFRVCRWMAAMGVAAIGEVIQGPQRSARSRSARKSQGTRRTHVAARLNCINGAAMTCIGHAAVNPNTTERTREPARLQGLAKATAERVPPSNVWQIKTRE